MVHISAYSGLSEEADEELGLGASEDELLVGEGNKRQLGNMPSRGWRIAVGILGAVVVGLSCAVLVMSLRPHSSDSDGAMTWQENHGEVYDPAADDSMSVRKLMESPEFANTITAQLMAVPHRGATPPSAEVQTSVRAHLLDLSRTINERFPHVTQHLEETRLSSGHRDTLLRSMSFVRREEVQSLGRDLAEANYRNLQDVTGEGPMRDVLKSQIQEALEKHSATIRFLAESIMPDGDLATLRFENVESMRGFKHMFPEQNVGRRLLLDDTFARAIHQQAQAFLDMVPLFNHNFKTPDLSALNEGLLTDALECLASEFQSMDFAATVSCMSTFLAEATDAVRTTLGFGGADSTAPPL